MPEGMESMGFVLALMLYGIHESSTGKDGKRHQQKPVLPVGMVLCCLAFFSHCMSEDLDGSSTPDSHLI